MASTRTLGTIKNIINSKLQQVGGALSDGNFTAGLNMALDAFCLDVDPIEAEKTSALTPIFDGVNTYAPPSDMRGDAILGIRPYVGTDTMVDTRLARNQTAEFDRNLFWEDAEGKYAVEYNQGSKILRLLPHFDSATNFVLNTCDSYNGNGTFTASDDANTVATDTALFVQGDGSVSFNITASAGTATLTNSTMTQVDVSSAVRGRSYLFMDLYLPSSVAYTGLQARFGSDSSNYYQNSVTTQFTGASFVQGWNLIGWSWNGASTTGTPVNTAWDYFRLQMSYLVAIGNQTGVRVDNLVLRDGDLYEIKYYTKNIVSTNAGAYQQYFVNEDDYLILNEEGEAAFIDFATGYLAPNVMSANGQTFAQIGQNAIVRYKSRYPSKRKKTVRNWYRNQVRANGGDSFMRIVRP